MKEIHYFISRALHRSAILLQSSDNNMICLQGQIKEITYILNEYI